MAATSYLQNERPGPGELDTPADETTLNADPPPALSFATEMPFAADASYVTNQVREETFWMTQKS
jgi:hypothetical protein